MGAIREEIEKNKQNSEYNSMEKDRTHPVYEIVVREDFQSTDEPPKSEQAVTFSPEKFVADIQLLTQELDQYRIKPFVMMENKKVWFDRKTAGLFPRFE
ncbi:MAG: hypothetical protein IJT73_11465, partial [Selenomonadaceae bacterium]|nr:hypothetical protein [Selenomonadaceae bacterium]